MQKKRVLLVDDEKSFTTLVKLNIEETGLYDVEVENNASKALSTIRTFKPDIIFLDVMMPEMDGSDVAAEIKMDNTLKDIPVVFLTAILTDDESSERNNLIGGHPFIAKPSTPEKIIECIEKHIK